MCTAGLLIGMDSAAQNVKDPVLTTYEFKDNSCIQGLSDNGDWAVSYGPSESDGVHYSNARLINTRTKQVTVLGQEGSSATPVFSMAGDVTDDGMVVGSYKGEAATWTAEGGWQTLPRPAGWPEAMAVSVTPDGRYAVGYAYSYSSGAENYGETPIFWDLTTRTIEEVPNSPTAGSANEAGRMIRYTDISSDGRYISGIIDYSYTWNTLYFIYDRTTKTYSRVGFDSAGTPWADGLASMVGSFSPNGKWFGGSAYIINAGTNDEYSVPCRYNMETKEFDVYDDTELRDFETAKIDNEGTMFCATPSGTPVRSLCVRVGKFWYQLDELLKQRYGFDFYGKSGFDNTGTCIGVSADSKTITCFPDPYTSYVLELDETFSEAASKIDLLATYTATPADGASVTKMKTVSVQFSRDITVLGSASNVTFTDESGATAARVVSLGVSGKTLNVEFRTTTLEADKAYTLTIPAGTVALKADGTRTNSQIVLHYTGRDAVPVKVTGVSPESGNSLTQLNATTNPVLLTFDTDIALANASGAELYREGDDAAIAQLSVAVNGNRAMIYPETSEYLYLNTSYKVVLKAGAVTDINGDNPNERYEVSYEGLYERIIMADDTLMYSEDFSNGVANMLLYEGDHNVPTAEMKSYDFIDGDNYPWIPVRDADEYDWAAASTSAYSPAGKSDDWMVTPQIYIPDAKCRLEFQAQGFRNTKQDKLKVIIYAADKVFNYLSAADVAEFRANGEVVMDEVVLPGASENDLAGDWKTYSFPLEKYATKNIYVAFVNENEDQSCVFVDNVKVIRDNGFLTALTSPVTVVAQTSQQITGRVIGNSEAVAFNTLNAKLLDAGKNVIDELTETGLALKKGDRHDFAFAKALPLAVGEENVFYIRVQLDDKFDTLRYSIKNLAFKPVKRVVVEEYTGQGCANCPRGHLAMENLERIYGDRVVPVAYHCYTGDKWESGMTSYTTFIGLNAAPSAKINRGDIASEPMYSTISGGKRTWTYSSPAGDCWFDLVQNEFDTDADANLYAAAYYDESTERVRVSCVANFAMNVERQNVGLLLVVVEDGLVGYQVNTYYGSTDEGLGEWTAGGAYGQQTVYPYTFNAVARAMVGASFNGSTGYIPSSVECGKDYKASIEFAKPSVDEIYNCKVVCMLIDANTGAIINVARADMQNAVSIDGVKADAGQNVTETARYNAAGQQISAPQKGLNIIRMSNGTSRKVIK